MGRDWRSLPELPGLGRDYVCLVLLLGNTFIRPLSVHSSIIILFVPCCIFHVVISQHKSQKNLCMRSCWHVFVIEKNMSALLSMKLTLTCLVCSNAKNVECIKNHSKWKIVYAIERKNLSRGVSQKVTLQSKINRRNKLFSLPEIFFNAAP